MITARPGHRPVYGKRCWCWPAADQVSVIQERRVKGRRSSAVVARGDNVWLRSPKLTIEKRQGWMVIGKLAQAPDFSGKPYEPALTFMFRDGAWVGTNHEVPPDAHPWALACVTAKGTVDVWQ